MLVILILISLYLLWLGFALRRINRRYSALAWSGAGLITFLTLGGFFGFL